MVGGWSRWSHRVRSSTSPVVVGVASVLGCASMGPGEGRGRGGRQGGQTGEGGQGTEGAGGRRQPAAVVGGGERRGRGHPATERADGAE